MIKEEKLLFIFIALFLFSIVMLLVQNIKISETKIIGYATEQTTVSNVTISKAFSIDMSANLSEGILFGSISPDSTNENATHNYDGASSGSSMYINVSADSNTAVDFCIKSNDDLKTSAEDIIGIGNETYANNVTTTDATSPALADETSLTTAYVKAGTNITIGNQSYFRFWLDVPAGQASGDYNNTIYFKGIEIDASSFVKKGCVDLLYLFKSKPRIFFLAINL
ncbi:unnamed protein product [marine sediment metagenome]|uniref:Uncharacterized protein n=1 Tax=marine sediment metagenome TaxID=412755 RepID=X1DTV2_9ZZZZ